MTEVDEATRARIIAKECIRLELLFEAEQTRRQLARERWHNAAPYVIPMVLLIGLLSWSFTRYA